jgi:uncharacterized protein YlxW (UPF0749 family)
VFPDFFLFSPCDSPFGTRGGFSFHCSIIDMASTILSGVFSAIQLIGNEVKAVKANEKQWKLLADRLSQLDQRLKSSFQNVNSLSKECQDGLNDLSTLLHEIQLNLQV